MKLPKKQAAVVRAALEEWRASGLLDEETGKRLLDDLTPLPFDWYRLGRYALWSALTCILIGVAALLGDELFLELISRLFVMTELGRSLFLILAAAGLFFWGVRRRRRAPQKRLTNEGLFFLGVLAIAGSLASLAAWLYAYGGEDIGFLNISSLFLLAAVIYGALGLLLDSRLILGFRPVRVRELARGRNGVPLRLGSLLSGDELPHALRAARPAPVRTLGPLQTQ